MGSRRATAIASRQLAEAELTRLFTDRGVPPSLASGGAVPVLDGGSFDVAPDARPDRIGAQVAQAVYGGLAR